VAVTLPYLASPGSIKACLEKIKAAATPARVTQDFVMTKLQIKGGTGAALIPYLKKIGFVASDGSPTELYKRYRNVATARVAVASAVKLGYKELERVNEYFYDLSDKDLLALIVQVTGAEEGSQVAKLTLSTLKMLKAFADFEGKDIASTSDSKDKNYGTRASDEKKRPPGSGGGQQDLHLSYTINLNLPATSDQAVFNAIFRSLKEHLMDNHE
jgi:hypothetical protein